MESITAVTATEQMKEQTLEAIRDLQKFGAESSTSLGVPAGSMGKPALLRQWKLRNAPHVTVEVGDWMVDTPEKGVSGDGKKSFRQRISEEHGPFDTIICDYLIGSVDGFAPYTQDEVLRKMTLMLRRGG